MIKAVSYNGQPPVYPLVGEFGESGGVIGRSDGNALVLPDPERFVSRAHATVAYRGDGYVIRDLSSASPVYVNGRPLGNGNEARLLDGDELRIGAYTLQVIGDTAPQGSSVDDPMNLFGDANPFVSRPATRPAEQDHAGAPGGFGLGLDAGGDINQMFGLGNEAGSGFNLFPAGHPLAAENSPGGTGASVDPLVVLGAALAPPPTVPSQRDDAPEIRGSFVPPPVAPGPLPVDDKSMLVSWHDDGEQELGDGIKTMTVQSAARKRKAEAELPAVVAEAMPAALEPAMPPAPAKAVPGPDAGPVSGGKEGGPLASARNSTSVPGCAPPGAAHTGASEDKGELLAAFLAGAGVPELDMKGPLDALTMQMLGHLLREATQGTLDLLVSRALMKREIRAEMTMIVPQENNPLKFSPNVEVALSHLLAPRGQGFLPPLPAMKDAYDDLRAHQFAFMAGMRAALAGVLQRFNPDQLEQRLSDKSVVDTLLPMNRKAKLWSLYGELYADINREAEDDFHSLFGKAFLAAYQAQLDQLQQDERRVSH